MLLTQGPYSVHSPQTQSSHGSGLIDVLFVMQIFQRIIYIVMFRAQEFSVSVGVVMN